MLTATEAAKLRDEMLERGDLYRVTEGFFRVYQPKDRHDAARFHADFNLLVSCIYNEARKPYEKLMLQAFQSMPPLPLSRLDPKKDGA